MRRLELFLVALALMLGFAVRIYDIAMLPPGFSEEEITSIRITENIKNSGTITVFSEIDSGGIETLYHLVQVPVITLVGDGLVGYRMLSIYLNLAALALLYAFTKRLLGRTVAVVALVCMSLGIWPVVVSRTATHVTTVNFMVMLVLWFTTQAYYVGKIIYRKRPLTLPYSLLAIAMSLAAYAHYTGILASIGVVIFVLYLYYTDQPVSRLAWWNSGYAINLTLILILPYLISMARTIQTTGLYILWTERPDSPLGLLESIARTFLAFFIRGDRDPSHNVPGIPLLSTPEGGVMMAVGIGISILRWRQPRYALLLIFFTLGLLPDMWLNGGPNDTALAFVSPVAYILVGVGVVETFRILRESTDPPEQLQWLKSSTRLLGVWPKPLIRVSAVLLMLIVLRYGWLLWQRVFIDWPARDDTQIAYQVNLANTARYLEAHANDVPVLVCTSRIREAELEDFDTPLADHQIIEWMMHRENVDFRVADCTRDLVLIGAGQQMRVLFINPSEFSIMPAELKTWLNAESAVLVESSYLDEELLFELDVEQRLADTGGQLALTSRLFYPRELNQEQNQAAAHPVRFGGNVTFLGYAPLNIDASLSPGSILPIVTYWRIDGPLLPNTGVFVRLHDSPQASPYTEVNQFAVDVDRMRARDVVVQIVYLTLPETLLGQQQYLLTIGVYDFNPTNQLPVYDDESGVPRGGYLLIDEPFLITAPQ